MAMPPHALAGQSSQATPEPVAPLAAGIFHSCATLTRGDARVRCWGFSGDGQAGYGNRNTIGDDETPGSLGTVDLGAGRTIRALGAGQYHNCAVLDDATVRCWGYGDEGQLGYNSRSNIGDDEIPGLAGPVNLGAGRTATAIGVGARHTCAVLDGGDVRCWGLGDAGQLGNGNANSVQNPASAGPVNLGPGRTAKAVTGGGAHTCAILDGGDVLCWGIGGNGQLGYGSSTAVLSPASADPVDLGAGRTAAAISTGDAHTCAILDDGNVRCWGLNDVGQLGYANPRAIGDNEAPGSVAPVDLGAGRTAKAITTGESYTCAVLDDGNVRCWGKNDTGQLGYGNTATIGDNETPGSVAPVDLGAGRTAVAIAAGQAHTCARLDDDSVRCWGRGVNWERGSCDRLAIGDNETPGSVLPVDLGVPGTMGAKCPVAPAPTPPGNGVPAPTAAPAPVPSLRPPLPVDPPPDRRATALAAQTARVAALRGCVRGVTRRAASERRRALSGPASSQRRALKRVSQRAKRRQEACRSRHGRRPGSITQLKASTRGAGRVQLTFRAAGTDGAKAPGARSYLVKQSPRPIRSSSAFSRAPALCKGTCSFDVSNPGDKVSLFVTDLRRGRRYYYAVAARDNVSARVGTRSKVVSVRAR